MKALYAGESETLVRAGRVVIKMRYASDREVLFVCSPEGARFFAAQLLDAAGDAEAQERKLREEREARELTDACEEALHEHQQGVTRIDEHAAPVRRRRRKPEATKS